MDPILAEIYSTVFQAAPYVIAAYVLMWLVLAAYVLIIAKSGKATERQLQALEDELVQKGVVQR